MVIVKGEMHGKFRFSLIWIESEKGSSVLGNGEIVLEFYKSLAIGELLPVFPEV